MTIALNDEAPDAVVSAAHITTPDPSASPAITTSVAIPSCPPVIPPPPPAPPPPPPRTGLFPAIGWSEAEPVSAELAADVEALQQVLDMPVWLLLQDGPRGAGWNSLDESISKAFYDARRDGLLPKQRIAVVIDSHGGLAEDAYEVAKILQRHCGGFVAVIPRHAKSAATLLSLGADSIIMADFGELGPLDVQIFDSDREDWISGLDEVQALERLHAFVLSALDQTMVTMLARTRRKVAAVLPHVTRLITQMTKPLFQNIDVFRYTQMSRHLKVGEEYAKRLLRVRFGEDEANEIASRLVENYPTHSFVIDVDEARDIGLQVASRKAEVVEIIDRIAEHCTGLSAIGPLVSKAY